MSTLLVKKRKKSVFVQVLNVFIKNPRLGQVKTRLAATMGAEEALRIYQYLLNQTKAVSLSSPAERWLWYSELPDQEDGWESHLFHKMQQTSGDLGHRMSAAFEAAFAAGAEKAVLIGSDCPYLRPDLLEQAFLGLDKEEVVIGPTFDGGYYLIGMRRWLPMLFEGISWSTETVFSETLQRMKAIGVVGIVLDRLADIDEESDWLAFQETGGGFSEED